MRTHHRLFAILALAVAATLPGIREGAAAQPGCPCWQDGLLGALGALPDLEVDDVCSTHPTSTNATIPELLDAPGATGAGICVDFFGGEFDFFACVPSIGDGPSAVAFVVRSPGEGPGAFCGILDKDGIGERFGMQPELPQAWACITDIAALCRGVR